MVTKDLIALLIKVIISWQVIAVTVVVFLYFYLVSYVARLYRRSRFSSMFPPKPNFKKHKAAPVEPESAEGESGSDDELGLEED
ncbi:MAG: hypothetical protein LBK27_05470 [Treponema sp.]|jgi:hypothetical protein|nr:hypothetical protein [Treponema sp.]